MQTKREKERTTGEGVEVMLEGGGREVLRTRKAIRSAMKDAAPTLVAGERGTGKRFVVRMIHMHGVAKERGFMPLHCRSLPPLSEKDEWAKALAHLVPASFRGTVYLDGLEGLPAAEREECIHRLLGHASDSMRLIASLNHAGTPEDKASVRLLSEKTGATLIHLPPLRERKGDILLLANKFLDECAESAGEEKEFSENAIALLDKYDWPGNVAELKGVVAKAAYSSRGKEVRVEHFPYAMRAASSPRLDGSESEAALRPPAKAVEVKPAAPPASTPGRASQRSIARSVVLHGRGLHSGLKTGLIVEPLPPGSGVRFGNLTSSETVRARVDFVDGTNHATNLRDGAVTARTIEHLMSALHAYRVSNILVKIGEEVPVMDGSAGEFCRLLEEAGIEEQQEKIEELRLDEAHEVGEPGSGEGYIRIEPADSLSISYLMDYPEPIGRQRYLYAHRNASGFQKEIAPARTFGLVSELKSLENMGLAEGGRLGQRDPRGWRACSEHRVALPRRVRSP